LALSPDQEKNIKLQIFLEKFQEMVVIHTKIFRHQPIKQIKSLELKTKKERSFLNKLENKIQIWMEDDH